MQPVRTRPDPRQRRALVALVVTLAALVTLWGVGAYLLLAHTPDFGNLPGSAPTSAR